MNKYIYIFFILIIGCAQIRSPTGGEKDTTPPQIIEMKPANFSTNFNENRIVITFDEYVKLNGIYEQLLVSPPLKQRPEIILKGKSLVIDLKEILQENTTYTFNLGEGIIDNNEGNILDSSKFVFSSGSVLDSLILGGKVIDAYTNRGLEASVLLHSILNDSSIVLNNPSYFTKSDDKGNFKFENLREGHYQIFALDDLDKNYKWSENENLAFLNNTVEVHAADSVEHILNLFSKEPDELLLLRSDAKNTGRLEMVFNKELDSLSFENISFSYSNAHINQNQKDSIIIFFEDVVPEKNCALRVLNGTHLIDTVSLFSFENNKKVEYPELSLIQGQTIEHNPNDPLYLETNNPIKSIDESKIALRIDTTIQEVKKELQSYNQIRMNADWIQSNKGSIALYPGAIQDIYGQTNDTLILRLKILNESDFGEFNVTVSPPTMGNYIFEVYTDNSILKKEIIDTARTFNWTWFETGEISLRLIEDQNQNGKWDSGDYFLKRQPERVWIYKEKIQIRPNWSFDQEWFIKE